MTTGWVGWPSVPIDESVLVALVDAAKLSTPQLERIAQSILGTSLVTLSNASTPTAQAKDLITYAVQYDLVRELAAALLYTGADRPGLQNLLLDKNMQHSLSSDDQANASGNSLNLVRLENRVERLADKVDGLVGTVVEVQRVVAEVQRTVSHRDNMPLNWNIIAWGVMLAIVAGSLVWSFGAMR